MKTTTVNIHLLPTNKIVTKGLSMSAPNHLEYVSEVESNWQLHNPYHLYITLNQSDLEISKIQIGDWYYKNNEGSIAKVAKIGLNNGYHYMSYDINNKLVMGTLKSFSYCEKIIATTDESILHKDTDDKILKRFQLACIPQSFIELYIEQYNKGNKVETVDIELGAELSYKLKLNNEISIILPEEKMYSEKEVKVLCLRAMRDALKSVNNYCKDVNDLIDPETWIKKNLK